MRDYQGWRPDSSYRRQEIWINPNEPNVVFCAFDSEGEIWDMNKTWAKRVADRVAKKIDDHLAGILSPSDYEHERELAALIRHNLNCHKIWLHLQTEMTTAEAENDWGLAEGTVRAALGRGIIKGRKSASRWLVKRGVMISHYGKPRGV